MRGKYITANVLLACWSNRKDRRKDIHSQLKETIAERRKTMREVEKLSEKEDDLITKIGKEAA